MHQKQNSHKKQNGDRTADPPVTCPPTAVKRPKSRFTESHPRATKAAQRRDGGTPEHTARQERIKRNQKGEKKESSKKGKTRKGGKMRTKENRCRTKKEATETERERRKIIRERNVNQKREIKPRGETGWGKSEKARQIKARDRCDRVMILNFPPTKPPPIEAADWLPTVRLTRARVCCRQLGTGTALSALKAICPDEGGTGLDANEAPNSPSPKSDPKPAAASLETRRWGGPNFTRWTRGPPTSKPREKSEASDQPLTPQRTPRRFSRMRSDRCSPRAHPPAG